MSEEALPEIAPTKKKGSKTLLIALVAVFVLGGGGGAAWWFTRGTAAKAAEHKVEEVDPAEHGVFAFEPFLVNLADPGGQRFVKTTISIVLPKEKDGEHLKETPVLVMRARSAILELLALQTAGALVTPEGKQALKDAIKEKVTEALVHTKVVDVLFSEFVVQF